MTRIVSAPMDLVIATHLGVDVKLFGLNLTMSLPYSRHVKSGSTGLELHLRGVANDETRQLDFQFYSALELREAKRQEQGADQTIPCSTNAQ